MKKLLAVIFSVAAVACSNPESTVEETTDTTVSKYDEDKAYNTSPGPTTGGDTSTGTGLDTSNAPKDTVRPN